MEAQAGAQIHSVMGCEAANKGVLLSVRDDSDLADPQCMNSGADRVQCGLMPRLQLSISARLGEPNKALLSCAVELLAAVLGAHPTTSPVFPQPCWLRQLGPHKVHFQTERYVVLRHGPGQPTGSKD